MEQDNFIGIGRNPNGTDLPVGLGMQLAQEPAAMAHFGKLSKGQKAEVISYIQGAITGEDAKKRISNTLNRLRNNEPH